MGNSEEVNGMEVNGEARNSNLSTATTSDSSYKLFGRQNTIHQIMGGGKAADVILWRKRRVSCGIIVVATVAWILLERSGLSFISICSDVLLTLVVLLFLRANYADYRNKQLESLPELVLSEEMINNAAGSFRVKVNYMLLMAHDIALGKDFKLFFKVVIALWFLSVIGSQVSFFTLAYIGVYAKYQSKNKISVAHLFGTVYDFSAPLRFRFPRKMTSGLSYLSLFLHCIVNLKIL